jgi:hypothetical protein
MFHFYAQISAPQKTAGSLLSSLAALTRLSRMQIRVFSAEDEWNTWGI